MITVNGYKFARNDREFTDSLFSDATCVGYYKPDGKGGIFLLDHQRNRVGGIRRDRLVYRASKRERGYWYQPAPPELIGGIHQRESVIQMDNDAAAALETVAKETETA